MKKLALLLLSSIAFISCKKDSYEISVDAKGIENGKKAFLETQSDFGFIPIDTVEVKDGKIKFEGKLKDGMELALLKIENLQMQLPFILENGDISIEINKDSLQLSKVGGTNQNEKFQLFNDKAKVVNDKRMKFRNGVTAQMEVAQKSNDTVVINNIMKQDKVFDDELAKNAESFLNENPDAIISLLLLDNYLGTGFKTPAEIKVLADKLDKSLFETRSGKKFKKSLDQLSVVSVKEGDKAPDFSAPSPEGKTISLKESLGKVTIIDFWASWCGPCRKENPNVVAMYNELHAKGLNIIGVSLDKDAAKWKEAIAKDGLTWPQISNLKFWDEPIAVQYNVKSIPATFILDATGKIVAKDLRGDALKAKVLELLAK